MKKILLFSIVLSCLFTGCKDDSIPELHADFKMFSFDSDGASILDSFTIRATMDWEIVSSADWCSVDKWTGSGNEKVTLLIAPTPLYSSRDAVLKVRTTGRPFLEQEILISQDGIKVYLDMTPGKLEFDAAGNGINGSKVRIDSSIPWKIDGLEDWVTVEPMSGNGEGDEVTVTVSPNPNFTERKSPLIIETEGMSYNIWIFQQAKK